MSEATALSILEQAASVHQELQKGIRKTTLNKDFQLYFVGDEVYGVCTELFGYRDSENLKAVTNRTSFSFKFVHPPPQKEHIIGGDLLVVTPTILKAAESFRDTWCNDSEIPYYDDERPILFLPGAFVIGWVRSDKAGGAVKVIRICFPTTPEPLSWEEQKKQSGYAVALVNQLGCSDVVIGGCPVQDVIPESGPMAVLRECRTWREKFGRNDNPVMPELVLDMIAELTIKLEGLRNWQKQGRGAPFLPPGVSVLNAAKGILGLTGSGLAAISAHPEDLPTDLLERIKDDVLD